MRTLLPITLGCCLAIPALAAGQVTPTFATHVRPILKAYCFECHGDANPLKGKLDLRLARTIAKGGKSGPALTPGQPEASLLLQRVRAGEMPPGKKKLSPAETEVIAKWIAGGARTERAEPEVIAAGFQLTPEDRAWWAFQPIRRPAVAVMARSTGRNAVEAFIDARLRKKGLTLAPETDRATLIRRATLDLHGLPPTPEEVDAFVRDDSGNAYEKVLERLLASPRYGERWARHWLDVAGYADSEGYAQDDAPRGNAFLYRDYVIRSFNADKPFDRFIREQIAGDELIGYPKANLTADDREKLIATGFLRMAPDGTGARGVSQKEARQAVIGDTIKIISSSLLGLTVGCAQCHNHRYDPIPQTDYYRLRAILEPAFQGAAWKPPAARQVSLYTDADRQKAAAIEADAAKIDQARLKKQAEFIEATFQKELKKLPDSLREAARSARGTPESRRTAEQKQVMREHPSLNVSAGSLYLYDQRAADELKRMADDAGKVRAKKPVETFIRALTESPGQVPATQLLHRGDPDQPRQRVLPGGLTVLEDRLPLRGGEPRLSTTGRRLALANWLTDASNPLTARVLVNRIWLDHFGRGLVGTPADFGRLGERPTHPELLDWLASEFVTHGWSLKHMHRLIMTSAAYRQSSEPNVSGPQLAAEDLARFPVRRLDAEVIRDSILSVAGKLSDKMYGPPVPVRETDEGLVVVGKGKKDLARGTTLPEPLPPAEEFRRSIYVSAWRSMPLTMLSGFDAPVMEPNCEARVRSTTPVSCLLLMNDPFVEAQANAFALRLQREAGSDRRAQFARAWRLVYGATPGERDLSRVMPYLAELERHYRETAPEGTAGDPKQRAMATICWALLNSSRFLFVE
jgi:hypothetical protein